MKILNDKNLVVCIEDQIFEYKDALAIMISQLVFKQILPAESMPSSLNIYATDYSPPVI